MEKPDNCTDEMYVFTYYHYYTFTIHCDYFLNCTPLNPFTIAKYNYSRSRNAILIRVGCPVPCMQKKLRFFGVRTAVWPPLLLFSGTHFRRKPSNASS